MTGRDRSEKRREKKREISEIALACAVLPVVLLNDDDDVGVRLLIEIETQYAK